MLSAFQALVFLGVCGLAVRTLRESSFWVDLGRCGLSRRVSKSLPLPGWAEVLDSGSEGELDVALLEFRRVTEKHLLQPLAWIRLLGLMSTALGFLVVAYHFAWLHADHGLLDLDPTRLTRLAANRSAVGVALSVATSATSVSVRSTLTARVRQLLAGFGSFDQAARVRWTLLQTGC